MYIYIYIYIYIYAHIYVAFCIREHLPYISMLDFRQNEKTEYSTIKYSPTPDCPYTRSFTEFIYIPIYSPIFMTVIIR